VRTDIANTGNQIKTETLTEKQRHDLAQEQEWRNRAKTDPVFAQKLKAYDDLVKAHEAGLVNDQVFAEKKQGLGFGSVGTYEAKKDINLKYAKPTAAATTEGRIEAETSPAAISGQAKLAGAKSGSSTSARISAESTPEAIDAKIKQTKAILAAKKEVEDRYLSGLKENYNKLDPEQRKIWLDKLSQDQRSAIMADPNIDTKSMAMSTADEHQIGLARTTLQHMNTLKSFLEHPTIAENIGPILGRWNDKTQNWTGGYTGRTPQEAQDIQEFLTFANQAFAWEVKNAVGGRPAHQIWTQLSKTAPGAAKVKEQNLGAIKGIEDSADNVIRGFLHQPIEKKNPEEKKKNKYEVVTPNAR